MSVVSRWAQDATQTGRKLLRAPAYSILAVCTLGLAIGLNALAFGIVDGILWPQGSYSHVEQLQWLYSRAVRGNSLPSASQLLDAIEDSRVFVHAAAYSRSEVRIQAQDFADLRLAAQVTPNFFAVLGTRSRLGSFFSANTDFDCAGSAVISYALWQKVAPTTAALADLRLRVNDGFVRVVGVASAALQFPVRTDVWLCSPWEGVRNGSAFGVGAQVVVRNEAVRSTESTQRMLDRLSVAASVRLGSKVDITTRPIRVATLPFGDFDLALAGAALAVLLVTTANLAALMMVRSAAMRGELAVRAALGAPRSSIMRPVFFEVALLVALSAVLGIGLAFVAAGLMNYHLAASTAVLGIAKPQLSWRVFALCLVLSALSTLGVALTPAARAASVSPSILLKDTATSIARGGAARFRTLVILEIAVSVVLLISAGILIRSARRVSSFDFGYAATGLTEWVALPRDTSSSAVAPFANEMAQALNRLRTNPEIVGISSMSYVFPPGSAISRSQDSGSPIEITAANYRVVSPDFLSTLRLPILAGRGFQESDEFAAVVDRRTALRLWKGANPVGQVLKLGAATSTAPWVPIVGVSRDAVLDFPSDPSVEPDPVILVVDRNAIPTRLRVVARSRDGAATSHATHSLWELHDVLSTSPSEWTRDYSARLAARDVVAILFSVFAAVTLLISAMGVYGSVNYTIAQRQRELALRVALGGPPGAVVRVVVEQSLVSMGGGIAIGSLLAVAVTRLLSHWLYGVDALDLLSVIAAEATICASAAIALVRPVGRVLGMNPADILRV